MLDFFFSRLRIKLNYKRTKQNETFLHSSIKETVSDQTEVKCSSVDESIFLTAENNMSTGNFSLVVFKGLPHFHENLGLCVKCLIYKM